MSDKFYLNSHALETLFKKQAKVNEESKVRLSPSEHNNLIISNIW